MPVSSPSRSLPLPFCSRPRAQADGRTLDWEATGNRVGGRQSSSAPSWVEWAFRGALNCLIRTPVRASAVLTAANHGAASTARLFGWHREGPGPLPPGAPGLSRARPPPGKTARFDATGCSQSVRQFGQLSRHDVLPFPSYRECVHVLLSAAFSRGTEMNPSPGCECPCTAPEAQPRRRGARLPAKKGRARPRKDRAVRRLEKRRGKGRQTSASTAATAKKTDMGHRGHRGHCALKHRGGPEARKIS